MLNRLALAVLGSNLLLNAAGCVGNPGQVGTSGEAEIETSALSGAPIGDQLDAGHLMLAGQSLYSNGYELVMQSDCNLVLYDFKDDAGCDLSTPSRVLWASNTSGWGEANTCFAIMQNDGNFVVYAGNWNPLWASGTDGIASGGGLKMQADGNAVIYAGGAAKWATDTDVNPSFAARNCSRIEKTYCCSGRVDFDTYAIRASRCKLALTKKDQTTCTGLQALVSCNRYAYETLTNGELVCSTNGSSVK